MNNVLGVAYLIPVALLLLAAAMLKFSTPNRRAPAAVFIAVWLITIIAHALSSAKGGLVYPSGVEANTIIAVSVLTFTVTYVVSQNMASRWLNSMRRNSYEAKYINVRRCKWFAYILAAYALVVLAFMYRSAMSLTGSFNVLFELQQLRHQLNYEDKSFGLTKYFNLSLMVFTVYMTVLTHKMSYLIRLPVRFALVCTIFSSALSTQRTSLLLLIVALVFSVGKTSFPRTRFILIGGAAFLTLFILLGYFVGKIGGDTYELSENIKMGLDSFLLYLLTPISALSESRIWENSPIDGAYSLRFVNAVANSIGLYSTPVKDLVMESVWVPVPTNVYTFAFVPVSDFSWLFWLYFVLIGSLYGLLFSLPRSATRFAVLQGFAFYPIIMSIFQDQFITLTSQWLQIVVFVFIIDYFLNTKLSVVYNLKRHGRAR